MVRPVPDASIAATSGINTDQRPNPLLGEETQGSSTSQPRASTKPSRLASSESSRFSAAETSTPPRATEAPRHTQPCSPAANNVSEKVLEDPSDPSKRVRFKFKGGSDAVIEDERLITYAVEK
jgi:hypothetical protein